MSPEPITRVHQMTGYKTMSKDIDDPSLDLESVIMQTCQLVYQETLSVLYRASEFSFCEPSQISSFQQDRLLDQSEWITCHSSFYH